MTYRMGFDFEDVGKPEVVARSPDRATSPTAGLHAVIERPTPL